jgi:hypothetical protein
MEAWIIQRAQHEYDMNLFVVIGTKADAHAKAREIEKSSSLLMGACYLDGPHKFTIAIKP